MDTTVDPNSQSPNDWEALFKSHLPLLQKNALKTAWSVLGNEQEVEEIVQEVMSKVTRHYGKNGPPDYPKTWVAHVTRNTCFDYLKAKHRFETEELNEAIAQDRVDDVACSYSLSPADIMDDAELRHAANHFIQAVRDVRYDLPEEFREFYDLRFVQRLSLGKIGENLDLTPYELQKLWKRLLDAAAVSIRDKLREDPVAADIFADQLRKNDCTQWIFGVLRKLAHAGLWFTLGDWDE